MKFAQILGSAGWEPPRGTLGSRSAEVPAGDVSQPWGMLLLPADEHNFFPMGSRLEKYCLKR